MCEEESLNLPACVPAFLPSPLLPLLRCDCAGHRFTYLLLPADLTSYQVVYKTTFSMYLPGLREVAIHGLRRLRHCLSSAKVLCIGPYEFEDMHMVGGWVVLR